jgi:dUTP pyrophosphatase
MLLTGKQIIEDKIVSDCIDNDKQEQMSGVDLTVNKIEKFIGPGTIDFDNAARMLPTTELVTDFSADPSKLLSEGNYLITFNETVSIPDDCMGFAVPRSTLLRMGATMETAFWDAGYTGKSKALLVVYNTHGILVHENAKLAQIAFIKIGKKAEKLYRGAYQNEGELLSKAIFRKD